MGVLKLYVDAGTEPGYTPVAFRGAWDRTEDASGPYSMAAAATGSKDTTTAGGTSSGTANFDSVLGRAVYTLPSDTYFNGTFQGVIGMFESSTDANAQLHIHAFVLQGESETLRGTIVTDLIDAEELAADDALCGEAFSVAMDAVPAFAGDVLVIEIGFRANAVGSASSVQAYVGGTGDDLADNGNAFLDNVCWFSLATADPTAPSDPTLDSPVGGESWREGSTQNVTYTKASPEQAQGYACAYEIEFSAAGTFADPVDIVSGETDGSYAWTLAASLVAANTATCKLRIRAYVTGNPTIVSNWVTSGAFTVGNSTAPTVALVTPTDGALLAGLTPAFVFGSADTESDDVHIEFIASPFADYTSPVIDTDSAADYADWEEAADPFESWSTMGSGGATAGNRLRYTGSTPFRYDTYYGKVRLKDAYSTATFSEFTFTISVDAAVALSVTIGGTAFSVGACKIVENTGGEASPIDLQIPLSAYLAHPLTIGDTIAISSGLGDHNRSWNGTLESWTFNGLVVDVHGVQDDAYLSRKLCTGDEAAADLGQNLADFITSYGAPLTGTNIDTSTGVTMALTGGYKYLREHFQDALEALPDFIVWVDSGGDIHFIAQADCTGPTYELAEGDPSA